MRNLETIIQSLAVCACLFLYSFTAFAQQADQNYRVYEKLKFVETGGKDLTLDLFLPEVTDKKVPCIIVIQGGGFASQDGQRFRGFAEYIASNNYAAALISYRGTPGHRYQTTLQDVRSAVCYIKSNSGKYAIDPDKIGAMGRSAGATLAALLAVTDDRSLPTKKTCDSFSIQAAVAYSGVFNFISRFTDSNQLALQPKAEDKIRTNGNWIGPPFSKDDPNWNEASAISHVDKNDSPVLFMHCKDDKTVPWIQSQEMYQKMKDKGVNAEILLFDKGGHGYGAMDKELYLEPMLSFFRKQFE